MASNLILLNFLTKRPNIISTELSHCLKFFRHSRPCVIGIPHLQTFSNHLSTQSVSVFSQCEGESVHLHRRRSLKLVHGKKKYISSQHLFKRKQDSILGHLSLRKYKRSANVERIIERENIWTIPNVLCVGRILVCPYLGYLIVQESYLISCYILVVAGVTDLLDGLIARNFKSQSSKLGSFLDPLADKVLVATVFLTLTFNGVIPAVLTSIIVARDVSLAAAGFYIRYQSLPPPKSLARYFDPSHATAQLAPTLISKFNTFVQLGTICCTLSAPVFGFLDHPYLTYLWWLTGATTVLSAASYVFSSNTYRMLKEAKGKSKRVS